MRAALATALVAAFSAHAQTLYIVPMDGQEFAADGTEIAHGTLSAMFVTTPFEYGTFEAGQLLVTLGPTQPVTLAPDFTVTTQFLADSWSVLSIDLEGRAGEWLFIGTRAKYVGYDGLGSGWASWDHVGVTNRPPLPAVPEPFAWTILIFGMAAGSGQLAFDRLSRLIGARRRRA